MVPPVLKKSRLLAALAVTACLTPTDPGAGDVGELRIRARFTSGAEPEALGVTVDSAGVVADTAMDPPAPEVDAVVALPAPDSSVAWLVDLSGDSATYHVRLTLTGDGVALYRGEADVAVRRGAFAPAEAHDVPVTYVGPGAIAEIAVTPGSATLVALGATQPFQAVARDAQGEVVEDATFTWTSGDGSVATVDAASGVATAVATGATSITATARGVSGSADLTVAEGGLFVEVTPPRVTLPAIGATRQFTATARDASGDPVTGARFAWTATRPEVVSVDGAGLATAVAEGSGRVIAATGGVADTADVGVAVVTAVEVTPTDATLAALGATQQFAAVARRAGGDPVDGVEFTWTSSNDAVAAVDQSGRATAVADGTVTITASAGAASDGATLTVAQAVASITVTPGDATLTAAGATQAFTALARDANGNPMAGVAFTWSSSAPSVAGVDPVTGVATAATTGRTEIAALAAGRSGRATLTVALGGLVVSVTPDASLLTALGATRQLTATASDAAGTPIPGAAFTWISRAPDVAPVDESGLVTAAAEGTVWIVAATGDGTDSAAVTVAVPATVEVSPATATLTAFGHTQQFTAVVRDAGGNAIPGAPVVWASQAPAVATVDAATGLATAVGNGTAGITATSEQASGSAALTVMQAIATVEVTPGAATLEALNATQAFTALARDDNGNVVTRPVAFSCFSSRAEVVTVDPATGRATAVANGAATIDASAEKIFGTAAVTVDQRVTAVAVTPDTAAFAALGDTRPFGAVGRDANGFVVPDAAFAWTTSDSGVAIVDGAGVVRAVGNGEARIAAVADGVADSARATVRQAVAAITVAPDAVAFTALNQTAQLEPVATDANGNPVTRPVTFAWSSDRPDVASVDDPTGVATAVANGAATLTVSAEGVTRAVPVTVEQVVTAVEVTPGAVALASLGDTGAFAAVARDALGSPVAGASIAWSSADPAVATVDSVSGLALAVDNGTTVITAAADGASGTATLTVRQEVTSIAVTPADATLTAVGATQQYAATARDANGNVVADAVFAWETSDPAVATVDPATGLATAVGNGTATVTARSGAAAGDAGLTVCVHLPDQPPSCGAGGGGH